MPSIKRLPRPRIQRAFVRWFNANRTRFKVPIRSTKIAAAGVELKFANYPDCLSVWVKRDGLDVHVKWLEQWWDMLISLDASTCHTLGGYKCELCMADHGESASVFPTREALWQDHLFDPFLKWVNEDLAVARWLQISSTGERRATWARLIQSESELSKPDRTLELMQRLKQLDGKPVYDGGPEGVENWLILLKPENW